MAIENKHRGPRSLWAPRRPVLKARALSLALATCFVTPSALAANAADATIATGTAIFNQAGNVLNITNSDGAILNWAKFGISAGEMVKFIQSSASSSVLNRVLAGGGLSAIHGTLQSNGKVFLVNPAGIMVGPGGAIDTAGFIASTLAMRDADFLAGKLTFGGDGMAGGNIINQGTITTPTGGAVYLIGGNVTNEGIINTPKGEVILAAGQTVNLVDTSTPGVKVEITGAEGNTTNLGSIAAEAGRIGMAGVIVRNSGILNASSAVEEGGRVFLKASQDTYVDGNGRIVATGTKGGRVEVLGNRVAVMDNASIDASGVNGGGTVLVGGDYQGKNPDIQNSQVTWFGPNASIKANATDNGDGGKVIVWSDDTTRAYGSIEAKGGAEGGNGGFVEVSGHRYLDFNGRVNTSAPYGNSGILLLDPSNILVTDEAGTDSNISGFLHFADNTNSVLHWSTIASQITSTNVTVSTATYGGDITLRQTTGSWVYNSIYTLYFSAYDSPSPSGVGSINLSNNGVSTTIVNNGTGNIQFYAARNIYGQWWTGVANEMPFGGLNITTGGAISFNSYGPSGIGLGNGTIYSNGAAAISVNGYGGSVGFGLLKSNGGAVTVNAKYSIWDNNFKTLGATNIETSGAVTLTSTYGGDPNGTCTPGPCSAISADIAGSPSYISATVSSTAASNGGGISIRASGTPGTVSLADYSNPADIWKNWVEFSTPGSLSTSGSTFTGKNIWLYAGNTLTVGSNLSAAGDIGMAAGNTLTINSGATVSAGGTVAMIAGIGKGTLDQMDDVQSPFQLVGVPLSSSGAININGSVEGKNFLGSYGYDWPGVVFIAGNVNMNGGTLSSPYGDILGVVGGNLTMNNGSSMVASNDVGLLMLGGTSTIYLNQTATTSGSPSYIWAKSPSTIYIGFLGLASGGIVIDGMPTTTTLAGHSGFFSGPLRTPAIPGSGLQLFYPNATLDAAVSSTLTGTTDDSSDLNTDGGILLDFESVSTTLADGGSTLGGGEGEFGGEENGGKNGDKDRDEGKDGKGGKGSKPGRKPVAQCKPG